MELQRIMEVGAFPGTTSSLVLSKEGCKRAESLRAGSPREQDRRHLPVRNMSEGSNRPSQ